VIVNSTQSKALRGVRFKPESELLAESEGEGKGEEEAMSRGLSVTSVLTQQRTKGQQQDNQP